MSFKGKLGEKGSARHTEDAFFFFPLWPDFDLVFFGLGFFFTSFTVLLFFLTPGPDTHRVSHEIC